MSYRQIIAAIVTSSLGAAASCGGSTDQSAPPGNADSGTTDRADGSSSGGGPTIDSGHDAATIRPGFSPMACTQAGPALSALTVTPAFDYVELRRQDGYQTTKLDEVVQKVGTLCDHATNASTCKTAFAAINRPIKMTCSVPYPCSASYLAYTRGDEVSTILPEADLAKLAAPIDSIDEAAFVLSWARSFSCDGSSYRTTSDGGFDIAYSYSRDDCPSSAREHRHDVVVHMTRDGAITTIEDVDTVTEHPELGCAAARRASDATYDLPSRIDDAGDWLAAAAHLEAASVGSFARLARELSMHNAPMELIARVARAAREERRHARMLRNLARAAGKQVAKAPRMKSHLSPPRSLEAIAIENAIEGVTRETWGAIVVAYQARSAESEAMRSAFDAIAHDEASHAELASDVAAWLETRLEAEPLARVEAKRSSAIAAIARGFGGLAKPPKVIERSGRELAAQIPAHVRKQIGLPSRDVAQRLFTNAQRYELLAA